MSDPSEREIQWLHRLRDLSHKMAAERDLERLLPMILDAAIELTEAERGFLVLTTRNVNTERVRLKVSVARGFDKTKILGGAGMVSRTAVMRALDEDRSVLTTSEGDKDLTGVTSVRERRVLSIMCMPLKIREETKGVLYLDHRFDPRAFTEEDLPSVTAFAGQAALALETAQLLSDRESRNQELGSALRELEEAKAQRRSTEHASRSPLPSEIPHFGNLVGGSEAMWTLYEAIERAARSRAPVLVAGASGTGKELVAREIHRRGSGSGEPFLSYACASVPDPLLESELFGHKQGAFTGAERDRKGLFLEAGHGTLLLDEVGDMSEAMQSKLLRVLQEGRSRPIGGDRFHPIGCRLIATSQHDLGALVEQSRFREDLYYRLDVLRVHVPRLIERRTDLPVLFSHFFKEEGAGKIELSEEAMGLLLAHSWPGNVRELRNEVRRLVTLGKPQLTSSDLSAEIRLGRPPQADPGYAGKTLGQVEREMIEAALRSAQGNKSQAARLLGVPRSTLYDLMQRHGLQGK